MTLTFTVGRSNLRRTAWARHKRRRRSRRGGVRMAHRLVRAHVQQHHLRRLRRRDEVLGVLPDRRSDDWAAFRSGASRTSPSRAARASRSASATTATCRSPMGRCIAARRGAQPASSTARRTGANCARSTTTTCAAAPTRVYEPTREAEQALLRPLFTTSFLIDDFLADNDYFGAQPVVLSSASSKTAYGTAFCIARRRGAPGASGGRADLARPTPHSRASSAATTRCSRYDDVAALPPTRRPRYVDMSGSAAVARGRARPSSRTR